MRGRAPAASHRRPHGGITPAYAGKSPRRTCPSARAWDHPRVCGEEPKSRRSTCPPSGSPPRMRGRAGDRGSGHTRHGITPAYAGKRRAGHTLPFGGGDHPRVCGEEISSTLSASISLGSPPRMRGRVLRAMSPENARGITPAYAGKSDKRALRCYTLGDHPRVCGEESAVGLGPRKGPGSPPRMRGRAECKTGKRREVGITPAYAGKRQ